MSKIFNLDNWFFRGITKIVYMLALNALFVIGSLPIFTIGASYSALYYTINKNLQADRGYTFRCYWEGFKSNFKRSTITTLIFMAVILVFLGDEAVLVTLSQSGMIPEGFEVLFYILIGFVVLIAVWTYGYIAIFEDTVKNTLFNAIKLMIAELPCTLLAALMIAVAVFIVWLDKWFLLIVPVLLVWMISIRMQKRFLKYMTEEQREKANELYDAHVYEKKRSASE